MSKRTEALPYHMQVGSNHREVHKGKHQMQSTEFQG